MFNVNLVENPVSCMLHGKQIELEPSSLGLGDRRRPYSNHDSPSYRSLRPWLTTGFTHPSVSQEPVRASNLRQFTRDKPLLPLPTQSTMCVFPRGQCHALTLWTYLSLAPTAVYFSLKCRSQSLKALSTACRTCAVAGGPKTR